MAGERIAEDGQEGGNQVAGIQGDDRQAAAQINDGHDGNQLIGHVAQGAHAAVHDEGNGHHRHNENRNAGQAQPGGCVTGGAGVDSGGQQQGGNQHHIPERGQRLAFQAVPNVIIGAAGVTALGLGLAVLYGHHGLAVLDAHGNAAG